MNLQDKKAIEAFERQKGKIGQLTEDNFVYWLIETCDLIKSSIGKNAVQENALMALFKYNNVPPGVVTEMIKQRSKDIERLLDTCVSYVKEHGAYKDMSIVAKSPTFSTEFASISITIGVIVFAAGWYFADLKTENKFRDQEKRIEHLENQVDVLKDSIRLLKTRHNPAEIDLKVNPNSKN